MICLSCENLLERRFKQGSGNMVCVVDKSRIQDLLNLESCSKFRAKVQPSPSCGEEDRGTDEPQPKNFGTKG